MKSRAAASGALLGADAPTPLPAAIAGGVPPTPQAVSPPRSKQLWYAVVFPQLIEAESSALLQRLCLHAQQFTSFVSIEPPNALLLEIKGSLKLLGPLPALHANIDACWSRLALEAHSATAPSTLAALWFARARMPVRIENLGTLPGQLAQLPIACTAWKTESLQTLRSMGVTRMGELLRLPRAGLARRLSISMVQDLDIALARQAAPRRAFVARERFRERCDFESEIEHVAYLEKVLQPQIERCARFLRERQAGVQRLRLMLYHRGRSATCVHFGLASVTSERRRLSDVVAQKLTRLELPAPVRGMELRSGFLQPLIAGSLDAFAGRLGTGTGASCGRDSVPQLVERLRARLGEQAVYGVICIPEHRPEAAWRRSHELCVTSMLRVGKKIADHTAQPAMSDSGLPRPVWLLEAPLPLPEGLILQQGPERIESGWWDGKGIARDYYVARQAFDVRQSQGAKLWVFQERQSKRWYVHGLFA